MDVFLEITGQNPVHKMGETIVFRNSNTQRRIGTLKYLSNSDQWIHEYEDAEAEIQKDSVTDQIIIQEEIIHIEKTQRSITLRTDSDSIAIEVLKIKNKQETFSSTVNTDSISKKKLFIGVVVFSFIFATLAGIIALSLWEETVAVKLHISPTPSTLSIDNEDQTYENQSLVLTLGKHDVSAMLDGYKPIEAVIDVKKSKTEFSFELSPLPGKLVLSSQVKDFKIELEETTYPLTSGESIELLQGDYNLKINAGEEWQTLQKAVKIEGYGVEQHLELVFRRNWAWTELNSIPQGASILNSTDRKFIAKTPARIKQKPGYYSWIIQGDRQYKERSIDFQIRPDLDLNLGMIQLELLPVEINLTTDPTGATVVINDSPIAKQTPCIVEVTPNQEQTIKVMKAGYAEAVFLVESSPGDQFEHHIELERLNGELVITTVPSGSNIYKGNKMIGLSPLTLELPVGAYAYRIEKSGYQTIHFKAEVKANYRSKQSFKLEHAHLSKAETLQEQLRQAQDLPEVIELNNGIKMVKVPHGEFTMGSDSRSKVHQPNELKQTVQLSKPFYISLTEVTNKHFREFDSTHQSKEHEGHDLNSPDRPVVNVSWENAAEFCNWLSEMHSIRSAYSSSQTGSVKSTPYIQSGFRLPTEAEFEYLLRIDAGEADYPWGASSHPTVRAGNYADSSTKNMLGKYLNAYFDGFAGTAPVASYKANSLGMHDLSGNAWEWCHNIYLPIIPITTKVPLDPMGPDTGKRHTIRGGSCLSDPNKTLHSAARRGEKEGKDDLSFRIILPIEGALKVVQSTHEK